MNVESLVEKTLFASRWLLCPLYIGLAFLLLLFTIHFFRELIDITIHAFSVSEQDLVVEAMTLIDLALAGGLIVMIMLSGYENYISKLDIVDAEKSISWLGKLDTGTLKLKVSATIVTISAVQLLKAYLEINAIANDKLLWLVVIHLTFVVSALLLTVMDRLLGVGQRH
ncbi:MAG: TIGR00645 family protein [Alphaproteobacteria bacterium]|nr:MAG: TIGR00645 family protein [Alphaproteobacteria bacterium]